MASCSWIWVYIGAGLMLMELVVPGFILCFFGLAAATVGVLRFLFGEAFDLTWQLAAFSLLSVAYIALLRRWFKRALTGDKVEEPGVADEFVGQVGRLTAAIEPPSAGRVLIRDAEWSAAADAPIAAGAEVKIVSRSNLTFKVEAI